MSQDGQQEIQNSTESDALTTLAAATSPAFTVSAATFANLKAIAKISGPPGFLKWDREVKQILRWSRLWKYAATSYPSNDEGNELCCVALRLTVEGGLFHDIENLEVAKDAYDLIVKVCKPKGSSALIATYSRFETLKAADCASVNEYGTKFRDIINELAIYPSNPKMDQNWLIYKYLRGLEDTENTRLFIERWTSEKEPFDNEDKTGPKHPLSDAIHAYEAQCSNPLIVTSEKGAAHLATGLAIRVGGSFQKAAQPGATSSNSRIITQSAKWCNGCEKPYHTDAECHVQHPHLKAAAEKKKAENKKRHEKKEKQRLEKKQAEAKANKKDEGEESWGATGAIATHPAFANVAFSKPVNPDTAIATHSAFVGVSSKSGKPDSESTVQIGASVIPTKTLNFLVAWLLDTGASFHMTHDRSLLSDFVATPDTPVGGIGGELTSPGYGTARLLCHTSNGGRAMRIHKVLYVPGCQFNLISFSQLQASGCPLSVIPDGFSIGSNGIHAVMQQGLYVLQLQKPVACVTIDPDALQMWHERLGHVSKATTIAMTQKAGIDLSKPPPNDPCIPCGRAAGKTEPHKTPIEPGRWAGDLIHGDLMGPFPIGYNKARWIVCWLDDKTQMSYVATLYSKEASGVMETFKTFLGIIEHGLNRCTRIRIDNGLEFMDGKFAAFRNERGIRTQPSTAGNPQMNGCAERLNQNLMRKASTFQKDSGLELKWWPELLTAANHIRNALTSTSVTNPKGQHISPFEASTGHPYPIKHFRRIGQAGEYLVLKPNTGWKKWEDRRQPGILVGYEGDCIYRMIDKNGSIRRSSNVEWRGNKRPREPTSAPIGSDSPPASTASTPTPTQAERSEIDAFLDELATQIDDDENRQIATPRVSHAPKSATPTSSSHTPATSHAGSPGPASPSNAEGSTNSTISGINTPTSESNASSQTLQHDVLDQHPYLRSRRDSSIDPLALLAKCSSPEPYDPKSYKEAMADPQHKKDWMLAMDDEMQSLKDNNTWKLVTAVPQGRKVLTGKWVYKTKRGVNGQVVKYKARWCVRGFEQVEGLDYHETFSAVVKPMSYKAIFAIAAANDWDIEQMDVKTAFLYGEIDEEVYVEVPHGYTDGRKVYCRLRKALYGLKQSPRIWSNTLASYLKEHDFLPLDADQSVFSNGKVIIAIYVDDLLIAGPDKKFIRQAKEALHKRFQMTDIGPLAYYLGMGVTRDRQQRTLHLSQKAYLEKVIRDHGMWESNAMSTPMDSNTRLTASDAEYTCPPDEKLRYQSAVGSLMYAMLGTRPDIAYAVSAVSRYASNPNSSHWTAVKRIFRYLRHSLDLRLTFSGPLQPLVGYTDADWAGDKDTRRSTSGYIFNLGSAAISWSSKRQATVALSTCEAEYMGQTQAAKEAIWLSGLLDELKSPGMTNALPAVGAPAYCLAVTIFCDNQGAQALARNPTSHARSKHIDIQQHFVRDKVQDGTLDLQHVSSNDQIADGLTKPLPKDKFLKFRRDIGLI